MHRGRSMTLAVLCAFAVPSAAQAAVSKPRVTTKAPSNVDVSTAQLNGSVAVSYTHLTLPTKRIV